MKNHNQVSTSETQSDTQQPAGWDSVADMAGNYRTENENAKLNNDATINTDLELNTLNLVEDNSQMQIRLMEDLALFDKYDYGKLTEESLDDLLEGVSTPSPTLDSESLIENVIWVNKRKLRNTDLSETDKKDIENRIEEAERAKELFKAGEDRKLEIEQEIIELQNAELSQKKQVNIHDLMTEEKNNQLVLRNLLMSRLVNLQKA